MGLLLPGVKYDASFTQLAIDSFIPRFSKSFVAMISTVYFGCIKKAVLAWTMGYIGVGITAWINIIALFFMTKPALACLKDYEAQRKAGITREDLVFDPKALGIQNADFWEQRHKERSKKSKKLS